MKRICSTVIFFFLLSGSALAMDGGMRQLRRQADSQYRMAVKAYNKAVREYGESLDGMPPEEKASTCKQMGFALHDNRTQVRMEDMTNLMKYQRQIRILEKYNSELGCN